MRYWVLDLTAITKHLKIAPFQLKELKISDYVEDKSLKDEIIRVKTKCLGFQGHLKCARFWLAGLFILAVVFTEA